MAQIDHPTLCLRLYNGTHTEGDAEFEATISYDEREKYHTIYLPGFDGRITIRLDDLWLRFEKEKQTSLIQEVTGYETIAKFNDTMQMKNKYTAVLETS